MYVMRRLLHFGPLGTLLCVSAISLSTLYCHSMWWPPLESVGALLHVFVFLAVAYAVLWNFLNAVFVGPGFLERGWTPPDVADQKKLQFCKVCEGFKAPRSHHCRTCNRCVLKMDHHCPWINTCCGLRNQQYFLTFLFWAIVGCIQASYVLACSMYHAVMMGYYVYNGAKGVPFVDLDVVSFTCALMSCSAAVGVILAVGFLFYLQLKCALRNRTCIEEYIEAKAQSRDRDDEFVYPYDIGWKRNFLQVVNIGDGISWPVVEGCDQYTLTIEQLKQKEEKRLHSEDCTVVREYNAGILCLQHGWRVFISQPLITHEKRLPIEVGERIIVTRWYKYWAYGSKDAKGGKVGRGWFPKHCVMLSEFLPEPTMNGVRHRKL